LLALLVLATPTLAIYAVWRQRQLRRQLEELARLSSQQNDALHRELLELRRQVAAFPQLSGSAAMHREDAAQPSTTIVESTPPQPAPAKPLVRPVPSPAPAAMKPDLAADTILPAFCVRCGTDHAGGVDQCPTARPRQRPSEVSGPGWAEKVPALRESISEKPAVPPVTQAVDKTPSEEKPVASVTQANTLPAAKPPEPARPPRSVVPPVPQRTEAPRVSPSARVVLPHEAARVVAPPQFAALRSSTPKPTAEQRMKSVFALEETLGTNWLNKIGIAILVLGVALFGIYELGQLGPLGKVVLSFIVSMALLAGGITLERRERYRVLGHTLIGGGWALLFFTSYALNHVQAMRVLSSENADLILMLAVALAMVAHTLGYRSQLVTGLAFLLAYSTVSLSHDDVYSLASGVILAIGLVCIVIKMGWFELEVFGILSSYLNHLYWLYRLLGAEGAHGHAFAEYHASTALLLFYWLIFRVSYVIRKVKLPADEHVSTAAALLNTLLLLGVMKFQSVQPELAFVALLLIGAAEFGFGQLPITKRRREAFIVLTALGASLMIAAVPFRYSGNNVAILWLIGGEALLIAGVTVKEVVFRRLGLLAGFLVGLHLVVIDFRQVLSVRGTSEVLLLAAGVMFGLCAVVFYANALLVGQRWKSFFGDSPDEQLLCGHSYLGGFAAVAAAWALCSDDWTAVAFAGIMLVLAALGAKLKSFHLQVQYGLIGLLTLYRVVVVNLHSEIPQYTHVRMRLITLPLIAASFYLTAKWSQLRDDQNHRSFRGFFALAGTAVVTSLIYYEVPELWQPLAAIAFAVLLVEVGQWIRYHALAWHAHALTGLAILAALTTNQAGNERWHNIPLHAIAAVPVVAGAYWIARRVDLPNPTHADFGRIAYSWIGTGMMLWVLYEAVPAPWIAVSWIVFGVALALVMRWIDYRQLAWQANVVAACTLVQVYTTNFTLEHTLWPGISLRLVTVSIAAAGLYFLSRKATVPDSSSARAITYLHSSAATALLALLAWYEAPGAWLAAVWAVFSLVLALVDRQFELEDLGWQAHALAALTMLRSVTLNLYVTETWHGISVRLLSLAVVTVVLYALSRVVRMPQDWRTREFHHIYSWAASALVSLLMWYELQPLSVAVGWGVFGLVLFEYGLLRNTRQFRFQAYVALAAAFGRIFFANLTAGNPGEFWGPRIYTVLPLTLIFFFVYAQLGPDEASIRDDRRLHFDDLLGYVGTGSIVALLYFQFANDWLVTAWAAAIFVLFGLALLLKRSIFLHQGILLSVGACVRGIMHNLFGASYFSGGDWTGRYFVLGSAVAVMLACLPFAFRLRDRAKTEGPTNRWIGALVRHPEQFMFFAPVLLLTLMLALKMRAGMVTVAWGIEGVLIVLLALAVNERSYRLTGMVLLLVCVGKIMLRDAWGLAPRDRYITFIILGAALLLVSFLYSKYRDAIRQLL
jgi:predicted membrane protein DUF2339